MLSIIFLRTICKFSIRATGGYTRTGTLISSDVNDFVRLASLPKFDIDPSKSAVILCGRPQLKMISIE